MPPPPSGDATDDWLYSDEEPQNGGTQRLPVPGMGERDLIKIRSRFHDVRTLTSGIWLTSETGYREAIDAGKEQKLQQGFDEGYSRTGAPLGRRIGMLRGKVDALLSIASAHGDGRPVSGIDVSGAMLEKIQKDLKSLRTHIESLPIDDLMEPDYELLRYEAQHQSGNPAAWAEQRGDAHTRATESLSALESQATEIEQRLLPSS